MATYTITTLDDSLATGGTFAQGINDSGQVVGYYAAANGTDFAFLYNNGSFTTYPNSQGVVSTTASQATASPVGVSGPTPGQTASGITQSATMAGGINNSGMIVGSGFFDDFGSGQTFDSAFDAFIGNAAGTSLKEVQAPINGTVINGHPSSVKTFGFGINNNGEIVGNYTDQATDSPHAFIDNNGSFVEFNFQNNPTLAQGINDENQVVGYFIGTDPNQPNVSTAHGFLYNNGAMSFFDDPNAVNGTFAEGINNLDQIVGYYQDGNGFKHGFIFNQPTGSYTTFDVTGAINTVINGINNNGQLVGYYVDSSGKTHGFLATPPNPDPPAATTAEMILVNGSGKYQIYDIGNNSPLASYSLTQIASSSHAVAVGNFSGGDTVDMAVRSGATFQYYDITGNNVTQTGIMGVVGSDWSVVGSGKFDSSNYTDLMMQQSSGSAFAYDVFTVRNNAFVTANPIATVGSTWQTAGFGDVNGDGTKDMVLRNTSTGTFEYYDIANGQLASAGVLGTIGSEWQAVGFGNFDNSGFSDLIMRRSSDGAYDLFTIRNSQIVSAHLIAVLGSDWQLAGFADVDGDGTSDMILHNSNTGIFEYYDLVNGQVTAEGELAQTGSDWTVAGIASDTIGLTSSPSTAAATSDPTDETTRSSADAPVDGDVTEVTNVLYAPDSMAAFGSGPQSAGGGRSLDAGLDSGAEPMGWLDSITDSANAAPAWPTTQAAVPSLSGFAANDTIQQFVPSMATFGAGAALDAPGPAAGVGLNNAMSGLAANLLHAA